MTYKEPIQRYEGLGEMDADQLAETTMDPRHRMLRRIRIEDAEAAERAFSLLMGSRGGSRVRSSLSPARISWIPRTSICSGSSRVLRVFSCETRGNMLTICHSSGNFL